MYSVTLQVHLLRTMLQWEEQLRIEAGLREATLGGTSNGSASRTASLGEVVIVCWPNGEIMRLRNGSTAADAAFHKGFEGKLVLVNGQLVVPDT